MAAGFEHRLLPAALSEALGAPQLLPFLLPAAVEQLALLRELYLQGGVAVPLRASCEGIGAQLGALLGVAEAEKEVGERERAARGVGGIDLPRRGLAVSLPLAQEGPPRAWAAPQFHHGVFRLLAAQSVNISALLQLAREGASVGDASSSAGTGAAILARSAALLHGGELAPLRLAAALGVPFVVTPLVVAAHSLWLGAGVVLGELWLLGDVARLAFGRGLVAVDESLPLERQLAVADIVLVGPYATRRHTSLALALLPRTTLTVFIGSENTDGGEYHDQMAGEVAVSFGHRRAADIPEALRATYHRLPWWLPYTVRKETGGCAPPAALLAPSDAASWVARGGFAALLSSHYNFPRPQMFNWSSALGRVDAPGKAFHNMEWPAGLPNHHLNGKVEFLRGYRFSLCPENSRTRGAGGYSTEKLAHAHLAGAVPVYWGDPIDEAVWNPARVIVFTGSNEEEVVGTMARLETDAGFRDAWFARPVLAGTAAGWMRSWCERAAGLWRAAVQRSDA